MVQSDRCVRHIQDVACGSHLEDSDAPIEGHTRFHFALSIKAVTQLMMAFSCFTVTLSWLYVLVDPKNPYYSFGAKCKGVSERFLYTDGLPSLLNLTQLRAFPNYMMRLGILPTMLVRVFLVFISRWRKHVKEPESLSKTGLRNMLHDVVPALHAVEVFCLSMILILHCFLDHLGFYTVYSICFTASSIVVMATEVYLAALKPGGKFSETERKSLQTGIVSLVCYAGSAPLVMDNHLNFAKFFTCSYLVPYTHFALELIAVLSYAAFHYYHCTLDLGDLQMCVFADKRELPDEFPEYSASTKTVPSEEECSDNQLIVSGGNSSLARDTKERRTM